MKRVLLVFAVCAAIGSGACDMGAPPQPGSTQTRFPIVLAEGLFGFDFFGIAEDLRAGGAMVFTTRVNPFSDNRTRGTQLIAQIEDVLAQTGATKVHLFGHSQGGLDARFILATRPELLASLTQLASPNQGSPVADSLLTMDDGALQFVIDLLSIAGGEPGTPADFRIALSQLSLAGMASFNQQFPAGLPTAPCGNGPASVGGIPLFSFAGTTVATNVADVSDAVLGITAVNFAAGMPNDGLVGVCSAAFGTIIRADVQANHLDFVNQLLGQVGTESILQLYRMHAARLVSMGL